jgi:RNA polymerase sigma-70 factor (ECF subfamily)
MQIQELNTSIINMSGMLFNHIRNVLRNEEDAKDIVQEVTLVLLNRSDKLKDYSHVKSFAFYVADNLCHDLIKYRSYRRSVPDYKEAEYIESDDAPGYNEIINELSGILEMLPEQQRDFIKLRAIEGLELDEIARIKNRDKIYVKVNLTRARKKIIEIVRKNK